MYVSLTQTKVPLDNRAHICHNSTVGADRIRYFRDAIKELLDSAIAESDGSIVEYLDDAMDIVDMLCDELSDDISELNFG